MKDSDEKLLQLCKYGVEKAISKGANSAEILGLKQSEISAEIELAQISQVSKNFDSSFSIRVLIDKKMGAAFTNIPRKEAVKNAVKYAVAAAKASTPDPDWKSLPFKHEYSFVEGLYKEELAQKQPSEVVALTAEMIKKSKVAEKGLIPVGGGVGIGITTKTYVNSNGVEHSEKGSGAQAILVAVVQTKEGMSPMTYTFDVKRGWELDIDNVVDEVAKTISILKKNVKGKTGKSIVVFHPIAYSQLLQYTLIESMKGDNVVRGKSKIADKQGTRIASDIFSMIDDGLCVEGINTQISDDEGIPRQRTTLIQNGVLKSFLWDHYWASKKGVTSTGNAKRDVRQGLVKIAPTTIKINPGERMIEEIIHEIKDGYYVRAVQGAHSSNPESGDFSIVGNPAILIENGEMKGAINGLMLSGNVFELLTNIIEVAKTSKNIMSYIAPEIVCQNISVITKA